jgi:hypothetical protein
MVRYTWRRIAEQPVTTATAEGAQARRDAQRRQLIAHRMRTICAKEPARLTNRHASDVVGADLTSPLQTSGSHSWPRRREERLPYFPDSSHQTAHEHASLPFYSKTR